MRGDADPEARSVTQTAVHPPAPSPAPDGPVTSPHPEDAHPEYADPGYAHTAYPVSYAPPPGRFSGFLLRLWARAPRWLAPAAILACFAGAVGFVLIREPTDGAFDETTCLLKFTTGYDCPGCGGTRAFFYLVQGNLPAAARHHLVLVFAAPFLVYMYLAWAGNQIFRWRLPQLRPGPVTVGVVMASLGVFTVLRNLPWAPFTWFYV